MTDKKYKDLKIEDNHNRQLKKQVMLKMDDEIDIKDYWLMFKRYWKFSLLIFILILGAVIVYSYIIPPTYEARSLVMVAAQDQASVVLDSTAPRVDIETEREIIMSTSVLAPIYAEYGIDQFTLNVQPITNTDVIEIIVDTKDPETAMDVANKVAKSYVNYSSDSKRQDAVSVRDFITRQLNEYKKEIDDLNMLQGDFTSRQDNLNLQIKGLQDLVKSYNTYKDNYKNDLENLTQQLQAYESKASLTTAEQTDYNNLKQQIANDENLYNDAVSKARIYSDQVALKQRELLNLTSSTNANSDSIQQSIAAKQKIYDYLLSRREEIGIVAQESSGDVKIIERATYPRFPISPNITLNIALGLIIAIIGSLGAVFLKDAMSNNYKSKKEIEGELGPLIGEIRKVRDKRAPYQIIRYETNPLFRDDINKLRTNLVFSAKEKNARLISVVSPKRENGKSTVAANLAVSLAKSTKKVLLVDTNLRFPILSRAFMIKDDEPGLTDVILDTAKLDKIIKIRKTQQENLFLLPAGKQKDLSHNLLTTNRMGEICDKLRNSDFDFVIFDNASLENPESLAMSAMSDSVLLVITARTKKEVAADSRFAIDKTKANLMGVVVNFSK